MILSVHVHVMCKTYDNVILVKIYDYQKKKQKQLIRYHASEPKVLHFLRLMHAYTSLFLLKEHYSVRIITFMP